MTTMVLTPNYEDGTVLIQVTGVPASPPGTGPLRLERSDVNYNRLPVRIRSTDDLLSGSLTVLDLEAALVGVVRYQVRNNNTVLADVSVDLSRRIFSPRLTVPVEDISAGPVQAVMEVDQGFDSRHTIHNVVGRPDPLVVLGTPTTRTGRIVYRQPDRVSAERVLDAYRVSEVALIRFPYSRGAFSLQADMYHVATAARATPSDLRPNGEYDWEVSVDFVEVALPETMKA